MKYLIIFLILAIIVFILWLVFRKRNPSLTELEKKQKIAQIRVKKALLHDKAVSVKHAKITKKATAVKETTSTSHNTRATKMSRLIKKKDGT